MASPHSNNHFDVRSQTRWTRCRICLLRTRDGRALCLLKFNRRVSSFCCNLFAIYSQLFCNAAVLPGVNLRQSRVRNVTFLALHGNSIEKVSDGFQTPAINRVTILKESLLCKIFVHVQNSSNRG